MAERLEITNAMLDLRRAVGMLAAKLETDVSRWRRATAGHSLAYLIGETVAAWQRLESEQTAETPTTPTEGT